MKANCTVSKEFIAYRTAILNFLQNYSAGDWIYKYNVAECAIHRTLNELRAAKQHTAWVVMNAMAGLS